MDENNNIGEFNNGMQDNFTNEPNNNKGPIIALITILVIVGAAVWGFMNSKSETEKFISILLDDYMSELDEKRRAFLQNEMNSRQVIMTTCEKEGLSKANGVNVINVTAGEYKKI